MSEQLRLQGSVTGWGAGLAPRLTTNWLVEGASEGPKKAEWGSSPAEKVKIVE